MLTSSSRTCGATSSPTSPSWSRSAPARRTPRRSIPNGSVTAAKLHTNAVTSTKIKNGTIKPKDIKKPTYVQSTTLSLGTPPAVPDVVSVAPYDFTLPHQGPDQRHRVHPDHRRQLRQRQPGPADDRPLHRQRPDRGHRGDRAGDRQRPLGAADRHASAARVPRTPAGSASPATVPRHPTSTAPGAKSWTIIHRLTSSSGAHPHSCCGSRVGGSRLTPCGRGRVAGQGSRRSGTATTRASTSS